MESVVDGTEAAAERLVNGESGTLQRVADGDAYYGGRGGETLDENSRLAASDLASRKPSKVPRVLRFPLVVILSLVGKGLAYSLTAAYLDGEELGRVSRRVEGWDEVGILFGWRTLELALGWFGKYDGYDLAALSLLSHGPPVSCEFSFCSQVVVHDEFLLTFGLSVVSARYILRSWLEGGLVLSSDRYSYNLYSIQVTSTSVCCSRRLSLGPKSRYHFGSPGSDYHHTSRGVYLQRYSLRLIRDLYAIFPRYLFRRDPLPRRRLLRNAHLSPSCHAPSRSRHAFIHLHASHSHQALGLQSPTIRSRDCHVGRDYLV